MEECIPTCIPTEDECVQIEEKRSRDPPWFKIVHIILICYSLYLCFKRNKGFEAGPFIAAVFVPVIYIPYALAVPVN